MGPGGAATGFKWVLLYLHAIHTSVSDSVSPDSSLLLHNSWNKRTNWTTLPTTETPPGRTCTRWDEAFIFHLVEVWPGSLSPDVKFTRLFLHRRRVSRVLVRHTSHLHGLKCAPAREWGSCTLLLAAPTSLHFCPGRHTQVHMNMDHLYSVGQRGCADIYICSNKWISPICDKKWVFSSTDP